MKKRVGYIRCIFKSSANFIKKAACLTEYFLNDDSKNVAVSAF